MPEKINTAAMTNEELVSLIQSGVETECAYQQLFLNLKPIILGEAQMYRSQVIDFDTDDFLQEGYILVWKMISSGGFKGGKFSNYYISAIRRRFISLYRSYTLKNAIRISEGENLYNYGYQVCTLVESDYARQYREKHREQCKAWYERKKARENAERLDQGIPVPERKKPVRQPKFTEEERKERHRQQSLEYYHEHQEECSRKKRERHHGDRM